MHCTIMHMLIPAQKIEIMDYGIMKMEMGTEKRGEA